MFRGQWAITPEKRCHRGGNGDVYQSRSTQAAVKMNNCARPQWSAVTNNDEQTKSRTTSSKRCCDEGEEQTSDQATDDQPDESSDIHGAAAQPDLLSLELLVF